MIKRGVKSNGYANRTPWSEAIREVPSAWLEDEARNSPSPYSLLVSWKGARRGVPSHVMIKLLRRRLREFQPAVRSTALAPARLQRAQEMLKGIWAQVGGSGEKHPVWRLVEGVLRMALERLETDRRPAHSPIRRRDRTSRRSA
jgi:hypothetical protein